TMPSSSVGWSSTDRFFFPLSLGFFSFVMQQQSARVVEKKCFVVVWVSTVCSRERRNTSTSTLHEPVCGLVYFCAARKSWSITACKAVVSGDPGTKPGGFGSHIAVSLVLTSDPLMSTRDVHTQSIVRRSGSALSEKVASP